MEGLIGWEQQGSEAGTHSPAQAQPKDFQTPENELQKLRNGLAGRLLMYLPAQGWGGTVQGSQSLGSYPTSSMYSTATGRNEVDVGAAQGPPASTGDARVSGCLTWHGARSSCSKGSERVPYPGPH